MNSQKILQTLQRRSLISLVVLLTSFVAISGLISSTAQSPPKQEDEDIKKVFNEDIKKEFNDDDLKEEKVGGKWTTGLVFDMSQYNDSSLPVVVSGIQSLSGGGKYLGITKIKRVKVTNRSPRIINSVQLRWVVVNLDDPEKVLSEGTTQFVNIWVEANSSQIIEIPTLYIRRMIKPLAKNGELYGQFLTTIGIQEARFADGSFWRRQETTALLKFLYLDQTLDGRFPSLASLVSGIIPPLVN
ncbi:MAG TPA: hypothetical protein VEX60_12295 [Pyrinomonadaceae bacterium]|nr:hypothetical protein [Pyrinomonadaceae bacterium]